MALVLERDNAILKWREMLGPTSPYRYLFEYNSRTFKPSHFISI